MGAKIIEFGPLAAQEGTVALALGGMKIGGRKAGLAARLTTEANGALVTLGVSKLEGETDWTVDSLQIGNGCPAFANGVGARYCATKVLTDAAAVAALEAAAGNTGLTEALIICAGEEE